MSPKHLTVVTQNVWAHYFATPIDQLRVLAGLKKRFGATSNVMSGLSVDARLSAIASSVRTVRADVVLVQELFLLRVSPLVTISHNFNAFTSKMRKLGLRYHTDPTLTLPRYFGQNSGLVIYSRYPILEEASELFSPHTAERLSNKGVIGAIIGIPCCGRGEICDQTSTIIDNNGTSSGRDIVTGTTAAPSGPASGMALPLVAHRGCVGVISTHLDSVSPNSIRFAQIDKVTQMVSQLNSKITKMEDILRGEEDVGSLRSDPIVVVGGDFNICPQTASEGGYDDGTQYRRLVTSMAEVQMTSVFGGACDDFVYSSGDTLMDSALPDGSQRACADIRTFPTTIENSTLDHLFAPVVGLLGLQGKFPEGEEHRDGLGGLVTPWRGVMRSCSLDGRGSIPTGVGMETIPALASDHLGLYAKVKI